MIIRPSLTAVLWSRNPTALRAAHKTQVQTGFINNQGIPAQPTNNGAQSNNNNWNSQSQNGQSGKSQWQGRENKNVNSPAAQQEAMNMVAAQADLTQTLDAKNAHSGEQVRATLQDSVQLKNGSELPKGTVLLGKVTADHVKADNVKLALCFDKAKLNDGKTIPVKATIAGFVPAQNGYQANGTTEPNNGTMEGTTHRRTQAANGSTEPGTASGATQPSSVGYAALWTPNTLQVDQVNVASGVDLHSRIHSKNSAVFVSRTKNDLRLPAGSQLALAIGGQTGNQGQNGSSPSM